MTIKIEPMPPLEICWNWISVKDKLPEKDVVVLAIAKSGDMYTARLMYNFFHVECECQEGTYIHDVTHWMPLPEPPKD